MAKLALKKSGKPAAKPAAKKAPVNVEKKAEKLYKDYFDVLKNAPRKVGQKAKTEKGVTYQLTAVAPPIWKKL